MFSDDNEQEQTVTSSKSKSASNINTSNINNTPRGNNNNIFADDFASTTNTMRFSWAKGSSSPTVTINTRKAMDEIKDWFCTPLDNPNNNHNDTNSNNGNQRQSMMDDTFFSAPSSSTTNNNNNNNDNLLALSPITTNRSKTNTASNAMEEDESNSTNGAIKTTTSSNSPVDILSPSLPASKTSSKLSYLSSNAETEELITNVVGNRKNLFNNNANSNSNSNTSQKESTFEIFDENLTQNKNDLISLVQQQFTIAEDKEADEDKENDNGNGNGNNENDSNNNNSNKKVDENVRRVLQPRLEFTESTKEDQLSNQVNTSQRPQQPSNNM